MSVVIYTFAPYELGQHVVRAPSLTWTDMPGVRQGASWVPVEVELVDQDGRRTYQQVDCPYLDGSFLVVKDAVLPRVQTELAPDAEFLPLACRREPLTLVNVLTIVDAVDEVASEVKRFRSGRLMSISRFAFCKSSLPSTGVFRVPQMIDRMFCTEPTAAVLGNALTGLNLQPVWEG